MAYVPVPKDLSKIKTKLAFNLTKNASLFVFPARRRWASRLTCFPVAVSETVPPCS